MGQRISAARGRLAAAPVALLFVSIASVQLGSSLAKDLYAQAAPLTVVWLRLLGAAVVLAVAVRPRLSGRSRADWAWVTAYGLCMAGMNVTFYLAIERIGIGMAVTLEFLGPLGVAAASSRRLRDLLWVGLAALGVGLLGFAPGDLDPVGVAWALCAAALWAAYILLAVPTGRRWSGISGVAVAFAIGLAAVTPLVAGLGLLPAPAPAVWGVGLLLGLLSSAIPYGLEMVALRSLEPRVFGILMSLEPAAAALFALVLLGEAMRPVEVVAMACVMAASIGVVRSRPDAGAATPGEDLPSPGGGA